MNRSAIDKLVSTVGLVIALVLLAASIVLVYAHRFIHTQVISQLSEQRIYFPEAGSESLSALPAANKAEVAKYAGQQLLTGQQAKTFADFYINAHLAKIGGGKTYSELSAASMADPTDSALAAKVQTVFRGETLRGMLLNAYAFDTMGLIALYAAYGALIAGMLLLALAWLGFAHAQLGRTTANTKIHPPVSL